jgi:hypothetical protein
MESQMANQINQDIDNVVDSIETALSTFRDSDYDRMADAFDRLARHANINRRELAEFALDMVADARAPFHVVRYAIVHKFDLVRYVH